MESFYSSIKSDGKFLDVDTFLEGDSLKEKLFKLYRPEHFSEFNNKGGKKCEKKSVVGKEATPERKCYLEIPKNPSEFIVYASIRQAILEDYLLGQCLKPLDDKQSDAENRSNHDGDNENLLKLPKMVMVGLNGIYELIRETHLSHPNLCSKSLQVLYNVLQSQQPESLKNEPIDVIESLYSLLMDLSQIHEPPPDNSRESCDTIASLACSSLISLVVAYGDPGKILAALSAMFISPNKFAQQHVKIPLILSALHKSVHAILTCRLPLPTWFDEGLKKEAELVSFVLNEATQLFPECSQSKGSNIASDGMHLYVLSCLAFLKVGTGFQGSLMGHIYAFNPELKFFETDWIGYCKEQLLFKRGSNLLFIDKNTLLPISDICLSNISPEYLTMFTDGQEIYGIHKQKENGSDYGVFKLIICKDGLSITNSGLQLKLSQKKLFSFGGSSYDKLDTLHEINYDNGEEICDVVSCKDFGLLRLKSGRMKYRGHGIMLGLKGSALASDWTDLPIIKSPKIVQMSSGHEGYHACLVSEDGAAYFVGISKRGEDGESCFLSKVRRAIKAVKPRKIMRLENKYIVSSACNYASTALVTKEGEVYVFGKDAYYCDAATGLLDGSKLLDISSVSMGKAHMILLSKNGHVYSFGLNNKGQCGRISSANSDILHFSKAEDGVKTFLLDEEVDGDPCCFTGNHIWHYDCCTICTSCKQCTGFGSECLNSSKDRIPGENASVLVYQEVNFIRLCGCGIGDPGCLECGICKVCAKRAQVNDDIKFHGQFFRRPLSRAKCKRLRERTKEKSKVVFPHLSEVTAVSSDQEQDAVKLACLPVGIIEVSLNCDEHISQVSCGLHHSVMLTSSGNVLVFGSNQFGQLGLGDVLFRNTPTKVDILNVRQVAAGGHHTVLLSHSGQVFTSGSNKNNQLGRPVNDKTPSLAFYPIPDVGASYGRTATWIHASGDQTFFKANDSLVTPNTLAAASIFSNSQCIGIVTKHFECNILDQCIMVDRKDGSCRIHMDESNSLKGRSFCFDPHFDIVWSYDSERQSVHCLSAIEGVMGRRKKLYTGVGNPLDPLYSIPCSLNSSSTRSRVATNVLACLDVLTLAHKNNVKVLEQETDKSVIGNNFSKEDFSVVNRFESHGGGWGYSGQSVEAIRFSCDTDIVLAGFGLFGGRGEYCAKIKLFELGAEILDNEPEGELLSESDEVLFRCPPKEKHVVMFDDPILLQSNHWYVAWARISGPSSDCGSNGQTTIFTDDQVTFKFRCSGKSNNGTDVNAGQIPQLLYKIALKTNLISTLRSKLSNNESERVLILSKSFTHSVSSTSFESLISLLNWSWSTFCSLGIEVENLKCVNQMMSLSDMKRLVYIIQTCLRLLRTYINICYSSQNSQGEIIVKESSRICECVADTRFLLRRIIIESGIIVREPELKSKINLDFMKLKDDIIDHCQTTLKTCFRVFYPTNALIWHCICELLSQFDPVKENRIGISRLLSCVFEAMCHTSINLFTVFTIYPKHFQETLLFEETNINCPVLLNQMAQKLQPCNVQKLSFNEIVKKLVEIATYPFVDICDKFSNSYDPQLVKNSSSLLSVLILQLISTSNCSKIYHDSSETPLLVTPSRFSKISQGIFWNSGNGSPDAVCFSVDKPGIVIVGAGFYAGGEGTSTFELEILADRSIGKVNNPADVHWGCIELVKGSYDIDDCINDIVQVRFNKPILAEENMKYALRLRNYCNRTRNGDDGLNKISGPDGTTFTFSSCSLSINGTNHLRGQLPIVLYKSTQQANDLIYESNRTMKELEAKENLMFVILEVLKNVIQVMSYVQIYSAGQEAEKLLEKFTGSPLVCSLIPLMCSSIVTYLVHDLHDCVKILSPLSNLLVHVTKLQQNFNCPQKLQTQENVVSVESDHPYKPASVNTHRIRFPDEVQWMSVEFDSKCCTSQPEDFLQIYLPCFRSQTSHIELDLREEKSDTNFPSRNGSAEWVPVYKKMTGQEGWPTMALILPGNELCLCLQSSSYNHKEEKHVSFGFKCQISGFRGFFKWNSNEKSSVIEGFAKLEEELVTVSAICSKMLLNKDIRFSFCKDPEETLVKEKAANEIHKLHSSLLNRTFPLLYPPTIHEALDGKLPIDHNSHLKKFLFDFIQKNTGTSGGRLAIWLQPEPYLEPKNCVITCVKKDVFCGWPCLIFIQAKDQYGHSADLSYLKLEAKAILILKSASEYKLGHSVSSSHNSCGSLCFGGHPPPKLEVPYCPSIKDKKEFYHSITMMKEYEIYSFEELRYSTSLVMRPTETMVIKNELNGSYTASWTPNSSGFYEILITVDSIRIGEPLKILVKDAVLGSQPQLYNPLKKSELKSCKQSRQFLCKQSAGLRIRLHPSLQSEQIGLLGNSAIISFTTQLQNDDGTWLKLSPDTMLKSHLPYHGTNEGWVLQYHQHFRKTLLFPLQDKEMNKENIYGNLTSFKVSPRKHMKENQDNKSFPLTFVASKCGSLGHKVLRSPKEDSLIIGKILQGDQILAIGEKETSEGIWLELSEKSRKSYGFDQSDEAWCLAESCMGDIYFTCFNRNLKCPGNDFTQNILNINTDENSENNSNRKTNGESQMNGNGITPPATPKKAPMKILYSKVSEEPNRHCDSNLNDKQLTETTSKMKCFFKKVIKINVDNHSRSTSCSPIRSNNLHRKIRSSSLPISNTDSRVFPMLLTRDHRKLIRKQKSKINQEKCEVSSNVTEIHITDSKILNEFTNKVMSPSLAECLRAMFAAFLWHKNIVQDAMACASFLKFHPTYSKNSLRFVQPKGMTRHLSCSPSEQENQQDALSIFFNYSRGFESYNYNFNENQDESKISKLSTLEHLVLFWDQLNVAIMKTLDQYHMINKKSNISNITSKKSDTDNLRNDSLEASNKKSSKKDINCDLCGTYSVPPITYHMRQFHPGCGKNSEGQGYNSEGVYCEGWAGRCGDGGKNTSTWYLMCSSCRDCYKSKWQSFKNFEIEGGKNPDKTHIWSDYQTLNLPEMFSMFKSNALFILDLNCLDSGIKHELEVQESEDSIFACKPSNQIPFTILDQWRLNNNSFQVESKNEKDFEKCHASQRPKSIYEGYKFGATHASATLYNLNLTREKDIDYSGEFQFSFHRSFSEMGPVMGREIDNNKGMVKKGSSFLKDTTKNSKGLSLLNHPSFQLSSMINSMNKWMSSNNKPIFEYILEQPFMKFCVQSHDLEHLVTGMKLALCKATCRAYALQVFNWLMRKVTLQSCLHDLLWHFASALMVHPYEAKLFQKNLNRGKQSDFDVDSEITSRHPLEDIPLAEGLSKVVTFYFHTFLQSLSDVMMFLPKGTSIQQMAIRCWSLRFKSSDHEFLHQSDIFKSISKILSESEQILNSSEFKDKESFVLVETLKDLTPFMEISASTHLQMLVSISDCSTETFWESGDDDRNKIKTIVFNFSIDCIPCLVCLYVDNVKDHGNRVSSCSVSSGLNQEELQIDSQQEVDLRHVGWINIWLSKKDRTYIKLAIKGPDPSLRIRQVKLLGNIKATTTCNHHCLNSHELHYVNCETETLSVFKSLTSQVFNSLIASEDGCDERQMTGDMEHVVGILFSQNKLTTMQKQVCSHILQSIRKETTRVCEAWELSKVNELSDKYCFELLNLVLALSGSSVGCTFVAQQLCLLEDLLTLLHTSSPRVQRQVVSLLKRLLVHIKPRTFAKIQNIELLDWSDVTDKGLEYVGIMDIFLICIAKCLSIQIKKNRTNIDTQPISEFISFPDVVWYKMSPSKWWTSGSSSLQLAEMVIGLLKDITNGKLTEEWANVTKKAIVAPILALSKIPEELRISDRCIKTSVLWLTLASLCVLHEDQAEFLSSNYDTSVVSATFHNITCDNHDDGDTIAFLTCSECGNLCAECDRVLHLSRKTKLHRRYVIMQEREIIKVDCHEGCGRVKMFWMLASADSRNMKAIVEFRDERLNSLSLIRSNTMCRFCGMLFLNDLYNDNKAQVCKSPDCIDLAKRVCLKVLNCGHLCGGIRNEIRCLPCLYGCKSSETHSLMLKQDADDMCMICFSDTLSRAPSIQLECGHVFHMHCCEKILLSKWTGPRITFGFSLCPICKSPIGHPSLDSLLKSVRDRYDDVRRKALMRLEFEGLTCSESIVTPGSLYYNDPASYAMHRYAYYVCSKCDKAYFGGEVRCEDHVVGGQQAAEDYDVSELVCGACSDVSRAQICPKHGVDFLEYKCRYCCSVAVFFCFGTTHFCSACHDDFQRITAIPANDLPNCPAGPKTKQLEGGQCPLGIIHPPTGTEFALGCGICRNAHTF